MRSAEPVAEGQRQEFPQALRADAGRTDRITLDAFKGLEDVITVYSDDDIRVTFRNGQEIPI